MEAFECIFFRWDNAKYLLLFYHNQNFDIYIFYFLWSWFRLTQGLVLFLTKKHIYRLFFKPKTDICAIIESHFGAIDHTCIQVWSGKMWPAYSSSVKASNNLLTYLIAPIEEPLLCYLLIENLISFNHRRCKLCFKWNILFFSLRKENCLFLR